jgi:hypothetical protein
MTVEAGVLEGDQPKPTRIRADVRDIVLSEIVE